MENTTTVTTTDKEVKTEKVKNRVYSAIDYFFGALLLGLFLGVVIVIANGTINLFNKWIPSTKKKEDRT